MILCISAHSGISSHQIFEDDVGWLTTFQKGCRCVRELHTQAESDASTVCWGHDRTANILLDYYFINKSDFFCLLESQGPFRPQTIQSMIIVQQKLYSFKASYAKDEYLHMKSDENELQPAQSTHIFLRFTNFSATLKKTSSRMSKLWWFWATGEIPSSPTSHMVLPALAASFEKVSTSAATWPICLAAFIWIKQQGEEESLFCVDHKQEPMVPSRWIWRH